MSSSKPVWRVPTDDESTDPSTVSNTLAELRAAAAAAAWPSRDLALRAARLATDGTFHPLLLRIGDKHYVRAARLWLQIASYLDDDDQVIATLRLAAKCARIGGNASFPTTASSGWPLPSACASSTGPRGKRSVRNVALHSIIRARRCLRRRNKLTAQERANLRASQPRLAIVTASLGGHPWATTKLGAGNLP